MRVKEESEKAGLKTQHSENLDHGVWCHHFRANINRRGKSESSERFYFLGLQNHSDCSHEIKRHLLLGRKAMTNLDSVLKSRDITLLTNVCIVKAMLFPVVT